MIEIDEDTKLVLGTLLDVAFVQMMTMAKYINGSEGKVPDAEYARFILFAMEEKLADACKTE